MGDSGDGEAYRRMEGVGTGDTMNGGGENLGAPAKRPRYSRDPEGHDPLLHKDTKEAASGKARSEK